MRRMPCVLGMCCVCCGPRAFQVVIATLHWHSWQGSGINVGLLYLGMVIKELAERGSTLAYRNSMLTEVLRPGALLARVVCAA